MANEFILTLSGHTIEVCRVNKTVYLRVAELDIALSEEDQDNLLKLLEKKKTETIEIGDTVTTFSDNPNATIFEFEVTDIILSSPWPYGGKALVEGEYGIMDSSLVRLKKKKEG